MDMDQTGRPQAVVTGASSGIGREFAQIAARDGYDLMVMPDASTRVELQALGLLTWRLIASTTALSQRPAEVP